MTKTKNKKKQSDELDGVYIFKLVLYVILGSLWLKITKNGSTPQVPIPLGLIIGLLFSGHEHFRIDRKIEYAVLIIAAFFGFIAPFGLYINF